MSFDNGNLRIQRRMQILENISQKALNVQSRFDIAIVKYSSRAAEIF